VSQRNIRNTTGYIFFFILGCTCMLMFLVKDGTIVNRKEYKKLKEEYSRLQTYYLDKEMER